MAAVVTDQNGVPVGVTEIVLSSDGAKMAFVSTRADLVPGDTNGSPDIFVQDLATGEIARVSTDSAGNGANHASGAPIFSPDGTKLAFVSSASNLVAGDSDQTADLFVKDLVSGQVERIGKGLGSTPFRAAFSPDGSKVAFASSLDDLVPGDTNYNADIFVADLATGAIARVSTGAAGEEANSASMRAVWSPDGTKLAFLSYATNLLGGVGWPNWNVFVKDLATGEVVQISHAGNELDAQIAPVFSPDGTKITFATAHDLYLHDLATGMSTDLLSAPWQRGISFCPPAFSPDGTKLAVWGRGTDYSDSLLLIKDMVTGGLMTVGPSAPGNSWSWPGSLSWVGDTLASVGSAALIQSLSFVSLAALDADKAEGHSGDTDFTFTVTRSGDLTQAHSVK